MTEDERGIVTPEAVLLEFETAGVGSRTVSILIDLLVQGAALFIMFFVLGAAVAGGVPDLVATIFVVVALFLIFIGYPIAMETLWSGRTLGKAAMGLRVVTREGAPIRFRHAAIRGALGLVDIYLLAGAVAVVTSLLTKQGQRLGDLAAGTLVLRERTASAHADSMVFPVPYGWESYVASLDVSAVSTEQYGVIRDFLLRVNDLSADARSHLGVRIANPVSHTMNHAPPAGVGAESFLVCVAAAYQQRRTPTRVIPPPPGWGAPTQAPAPMGAAAPPTQAPVRNIPPPPGWGDPASSPPPAAAPPTAPLVPPPPTADPDTFTPPA